jgi:hypothetical protein
VCRCRPSTREHRSQRSSGPSLCVSVCPAVCAKCVLCSACMCTCVHTPLRRFQQKFCFTSIAPLNRQEYKTEAPPWEAPLGTLESDLCKRALMQVLARSLTLATRLSERVALYCMIRQTSLRLSECCPPVGTTAAYFGLSCPVELSLSLYLSADPSVTCPIGAATPANYHHLFMIISLCTVNNS